MWDYTQWDDVELVEWEEMGAPRILWILIVNKGVPREGRFVMVSYDLAVDDQGIRPVDA